MGTFTIPKKNLECLLCSPLNVPFVLLALCSPMSEFSLNGLNPFGGASSLKVTDNSE
jgi:hypothetical protein